MILHEAWLCHETFSRILQILAINKAKLPGNCRCLVSSRIPDMRRMVVPKLRLAVGVPPTWGFVQVLFNPDIHSSRGPQWFFCFAGNRYMSLRSIFFQGFLVCLLNARVSGLQFIWVSFFFLVKKLLQGCAVSFVNRRLGVHLLGKGSCQCLNAFFVSEILSWILTLDASPQCCNFFENEFLPHNCSAKQPLVARLISRLKSWIRYTLPASSSICTQWSEPSKRTVFEIWYIYIYYIYRKWWKRKYIPRDKGFIVIALVNDF